MKKFVSMFLVVFLLALNGPMTAMAAWGTEVILHPGLPISPIVFGTAVAIDGDNVVVLDPGETAPTDPAYLRFYKKNGTLIDSKNLGSTSAMSVYGHTVDIDGDYAVVGMPYTTVGGRTNRGSINIFKTADGGANWDAGTTIDCPVDESGAFGESVAISGDTIVVGADWGRTNYKGSAYIYKLNAGTWGLEATITPTIDDWSQFGWDVGISGDYVIIGAPYYNSYQGLVQIYKRTGTTWAQNGSNLLGEQQYDEYGFSVSIDGTKALIGAHYFPDYNSYGKVYFYSGPDTWSLIDSFVNTLHWDEFGTHVEISGNYAIVGELYGEPPASPENTDTGAAYVYKFDGSNWAQDSAFYADTGATDSKYGWTVDIDGNSVTKTLIIGQYNNSGGYAYLYSEAGGGGGGVPEFSDYLFLLTIIIATGLMVKTIPNISGNSTARA